MDLEASVPSIPPFTSNDRRLGDEVSVARQMRRSGADIRSRVVTKLKELASADLIGPDKRDYRQLGIGGSHMTIRRLIRMWLLSELECAHGGNQYLALPNLDSAGAVVCFPVEDILETFKNA